MTTLGRLTSADGTEADGRFLEHTGHEGAAYPLQRWIAKQIDHTDFTAAAVSEAVLAFSLAAGVVIHDAFFQLDTVFSGGSVSAITGALGISGGDVDAFVEEVDIFTGASTGRLFNTQASRGVLLYDATAGILSPLFGNDVGTSAIEVDVTAVATGDDVVALDAGQVTVYLLISDPIRAVLET